MATKLVVSFDALSISNLSSFVSSRNINEVIVVGTSSDFGNVGSTGAAARSMTTIANAKTALGKVNSSLSFALADDTSAELTAAFYDYLALNNISFFVDSDLSSLSSSLVIEDSNISGSGKTKTIASADSFDTSTLSNNKLFIEAAGTLDLGSNFASKPTITSLSGNYLSDLSNSIKVNITAQKIFC